MKSINKILLATSILFSFLFLALSQQTHISNSEIWAVNFSQLFPFNIHINESILQKSLFYSFIRPVYFFSDSSWSLFMMARAFFAFLGLSILVLVYKLSLLLTQKKTAALWSVFLLVTSTLFLERGFRIRSDYLACVCHLGFLYYFLTLLRGNKKASLPHVIILSLLNLLTILATPKAIYFLTAEVILFISIYFLNSQKIKSWWPILWVPFVFIMVINLLVGLVFSFNRLSLIYSGAIEYYLNLYTKKVFGVPHFWTDLAFTHVTKFIIYNPLLLTLVYASVFIFCLNTLSRKTYVYGSDIYMKLTFLYSSLMVLIVVFHNDRLPFFILSYLAFCFISAGYLLDKLLSINKKVKVLLSIILITCLSLKAGSWMNLMHIKNTNFQQKEYINNLEDYLSTLPEIKYYDIIGLIPKRSQFFIYAGPALENRNFETVNLVFKSKPDLILRGANSNFLQPYLNYYLQNLNYVSVENVYYLKSFMLKNKSLEELKEYTHKGLYYLPVKRVLDKFLSHYKGKSHPLMKIQIYSEETKQSKQQLHTWIAWTKGKESALASSALSLSDIYDNFEYLAVSKNIKAIYIPLFESPPDGLIQDVESLFRFDNIHY